MTSRTASPVEPAWPSQRASQWLPLMAAAVIVLSGVVVYANSLATPFVFDDIESIVENSSIRRLWPLDRALSPPNARGVTVGARPLLNMSFALNYALTGTEVWSYHALNVAIHLLAGLTSRARPALGAAAADGGQRRRPKHAQSLQSSSPMALMHAAAFLPLSAARLAYK